MTQVIRPEIQKVGIVGGGVIGAGWAARFALNGIDAAVYDPDPEIERKTAAVLANARRAMSRLFGEALPPEGRVTFVASLAEAVRGADFIQESLPEREDLKVRPPKLMSLPWSNAQGERKRVISFLSNLRWKASSTPA